jgi:hypothetical protein
MVFAAADRGVEDYVIGTDAEPRSVMEDVRTWL